MSRVILNVTSAKCVLHNYTHAVDDCIFTGQLAYIHDVKTRLSTLGTGDVPRGSDAT